MVDKSKLLNYVLFLLLTLAALFLVKFFDISYPITVSTVTRLGELAVVGEGKVDVVPDTIYVTAGIQVNNVVTAEAVKTRIDEVNNKIIEAVKTLGVPKENIKTSNYNIFPDYSFTPQDKNKISGYQGNATVEIKVKDTKLATQVVDEATKAGANQIQGTRFVVDDPQVFRDQARDKAIANAKEQAEKLSKTLGIRLGKIVNIVESSGGAAVPLYDTKAALGRGSGPEFEPGTQTISSTVTLYFERK